jgi:hypothetical protein
MPSRWAMAELMIEELSEVVDCSLLRSGLLGLMQVFKRQCGSLLDLTLIAAKLPVASL